MTLAQVLHRQNLNPLNNLKFILFGRELFSTQFKAGQMNWMRVNKMNNSMNSLSLAKFVYCFISKGGDGLQNGSSIITADLISANLSSAGYCGEQGKTQSILGFIPQNNFKKLKGGENG